MNGDRLEEEVRDLLRSEVSCEAFLLEGLEGRITTELAGRLPRSGPFDVLRRLLAPTRGARIAQLGVVTATALLFLVVGAFLAERLPFYDGGVPAHPVALTGGSASGTESQVLFVMPAPKAQNVAVLGTFNGWEPTSLSDEDKDGIWTARIALPPGRYEYAFVVDGRWWGQDPLADEYVRSFGQYNSVRYVGRAGDGA